MTDEARIPVEWTGGSHTKPYVPPTDDQRISDHTFVHRASYTGTNNSDYCALPECGRHRAYHRWQA